jgi:hypothetical protein
VVGCAQLFTIAVFNGANYYIEVFSVRYVNKYPRERPLVSGGFATCPCSSEMTPGLRGPAT